MPEFLPGVCSFPSADEWVIQLWFVGAMEDYSTISVYTCNKNLGESSENYAERTKPSQKVAFCVIPFMSHSRNDKMVAMETRSVAA